MQKSEIIKTYARHEGDTGSPEVQIALLTSRIRALIQSGDIEQAQALLRLELSDEAAARRNILK